MAVAPTGAIYKALEFDGVSSRSYGIYITGEAVYNAPERDVEMITIPGRNGAFALDNGRFQNIEVTYPAGIFAENETDFAQAISDFRNFLCSKVGYCRITDDYNPNEFRMAVYKSGLEVTPFQLKAGEFQITFECKPQRYLTSGEEAVTIANSGDTIVNSTLFDSKPLLEIDGHGDIGIGEYGIHIDDIVMGEINVSDKITVQNQTINRTWSINEADYNAGDNIVINGLTLQTVFTIMSSAHFLDSKDDRTMGIEYYNSTDSDATLSYSKSGKTAIFGVDVPAITLTIGQNLSRSYSIRATVIVESSGGSQWQSNRVNFVITVNYTNGTLQINAERLLFNSQGYVSIASPQELCTITLGTIAGNSTVSILDSTIYIDCDIGEAYAIRGGIASSLNSIVELGSDLPKLKPGVNIISYSADVSDLKITPRWWKV